MPFRKLDANQTPIHLPSKSFRVNSSPLFLLFAMHPLVPLTMPWVHGYAEGQADMARCQGARHSTGQAVALAVEFAHKIRAGNLHVSPITFPSITEIVMQMVVFLLLYVSSVMIFTRSAFVCLL
jgi:hypothetical protein